MHRVEGSLLAFYDRLGESTLILNLNELRITWDLENIDNMRDWIFAIDLWFDITSLRSANIKASKSCFVVFKEEDPGKRLAGDNKLAFIYRKEGVYASCRSIHTQEKSEKRRKVLRKGRAAQNCSKSREKAMSSKIDGISFEEEVPLVGMFVHHRTALLTVVRRKSTTIQ